MGAEIERLEIAVETEAEKANKQIDQMLQKLEKLSDSLTAIGAKTGNLGKLGDRLEKISQNQPQLASGFGKITSSMASTRKQALNLAVAFGKVYAGYRLITFGAGKLKNAIDISSDLTEIQNVIDVTFGGYKSRIEDFASSSITDFGMSELTAKQISSRFQAMGTAIGFSQDKMADMSVELTKLAADMASFYNVDQSTVSKGLEAIFTGQTRPLRTYGIDLTQATLKEWAMKQGLDANVESMSQAQKTMLRYQYVMAHTTAAQGDFARTSGTWANQTRILSQQFQAFASVVGGVFINALKPFVSALNAVMAKVTQFSQTIANALGAIFGWTIEIDSGGMTNDFSDIADSTEDTAGNLGNAAEAAKKLKNYVLGFDEINILGDNQVDTGSGANSSGSGSGSTGGAGGANLVRVESVLDKYKSEIKNLHQLGEYIGQALTGAMNSIDWDSVYAGARNFGKGLADFLNGLISPELFGSTGRTIASALNTGIYAALSFGENFDWENFGLSISEGINEFFSTFDFGALAGTINTWVQGIAKSIGTAIDNIDFKKVASGIYDFFSNLEIETIGLVVGSITIKYAGQWLTNSAFREAIKKWLLANSGIVITLETLFVNITGFGFAVNAIAFSEAANKLLDGISVAIDTLLPDWAYDLLSKMGAGLVVGVAAGAFAGPAGMVAGGIIGAIGGALWSQWDRIVAWWNSSVGEWWQNDVSPWFTKEKWSGLLGNIKQSLKEKWNETVGQWSADISSWWNNNVAPWFKKEKWSDLFKSVGNSLSSEWSETVKNWKADISNWWNENVAPWFTKDKWTLDGIEAGLSQAFDNAVASMKQIWNKFAEWLNDKLDFSWDSFEIAGKEIIPAGHLSLGHIPTFASGGYPNTGELFLARENGINEMVGRIGSRSAVANNDQIVEAITNSVAPAVYEAVTAAFVNNGIGSGNQSLPVEVEIKVDTETLYKAVKNGEMKHDRRYHVVATI